MPIKFADIKTRDELLTRVHRHVDTGEPQLSCGSQYPRIKHMLFQEPSAEHPLLVRVHYTAAGKSSVLRYV